MRARIEAAREYERIRRSMLPSLAWSERLEAALRDMHARQQMLNSIMGPADHTRMFQDVLKGMGHVPWMQPFIDRVQLQNEHWRTAFGAIEPQRGFTIPPQRGFTIPHRNLLQESWSTWQSASEQMARALAPLPETPRSAAALARITAPLDLFSRYAQGAVTALEQTDDELEAVAATTALSLANEQVTEAAALGTLLLEEEAFEPTEVVDGAGAVSLLELPETAQLFYVQQREIVAKGPAIITLRPSELLLVPPAARLAERARRVVQLVCECNRAAKYGGREEIFKPTTTLIESSTNLSFIVATDRDSLARFIDCLFFTLYEGAGDDRLRFMAENGGVFDRTDSRCNVIWAIKALRNKTMRHDPDHGAEKKIDKSWAGLNEALSGLGIGNWPVSPEDFTRIQEVVLEETVTFLSELLVQLAKGDSSGVAGVS